MGISFSLFLCISLPVVTYRMRVARRRHHRLLLLPAGKMSGLEPRSPIHITVHSSTVITALLPGGRGGVGKEVFAQEEVAVATMWM